MPTLPQGYTLKPGQLAHPVLWHQSVRLPNVTPDVSDAALAQVFADGESRSRRLKTFGHDAKGVHWLITRNGTTMHTDPGYTRYTHQLVLRNERWMLHGLYGPHPNDPPIQRGSMLCLDTWSPHQVSPDPRLLEQHAGSGCLYKVQIVVDSKYPLSPEEAWALLSTRLTDPCPGPLPDPVAAE